MANVTTIDSLDTVLETKRQTPFDVFSVTDFEAWTTSNESDIRLVAHNRSPEAISDLAIEILDDKITITTKTPEPWDVVDTTVLTWEQIRNSNLSSGADFWLLNFQGVDVFDATNEKVAGKHDPIFNLFPLTSESKNTVDKHAKALPGNKFHNFYKLFVRPEATGFLKCFHHLEVSTATQITSNIDLTRATSPNPNAKFQPPAYDVFFRLGARWISQDTNGGIIEVGLMNNANVDIYSKSDVGHVPRKVTMENGRARIKFSSIGMESGDQAEIKLGFKWFTNAATLVYTKP